MKEGNKENIKGKRYRETTLCVAVIKGSTEMKIGSVVYAYSSGYGNGVSPILCPCTRRRYKQVYSSRPQVLFILSTTIPKSTPNSRISSSTGKVWIFRGAWML